eukprot:scaffold378_cov270-Chaetoceros_neogracile.AAC.34
MARKQRRYQPSREKLDQSVSDILDKAVNADSSNAPKQLHLILTTEHPEWKLPERRVAKYLKRQLKKRNNERYKDIDADLDEVSIYTEASNATWRISERAPAAAAPVPAPTEIRIKTKARTGIVKAYEDDNNKNESVPLFCEGCVIS